LTPHIQQKMRGKMVKVTRKAPTKAADNFAGVGESSDPASVPDDLKPIDGLQLHASSLMLADTGNEFLVTFSSVLPGVRKDGSQSGHAISKPEVTLSMSPQTAKDASIVLAKAVEDHEAKFGEIVTPFTLRRAATNVKPETKRH
jgi:hypothetical protein